MTQTRPDPRIEGDGAAGPRTAPAEPPTVLLRNEDDDDHMLDVYIAAADDVLVDDSHTVAGDSQRIVDATAEGRGTVHVELRADNGGSASLAFDPEHPGPTPVPEFVVRAETIVVAGLY